MWLPVSAGGIGLRRLRDAGVYLAGVRSALDISRAQRHCTRPMIAAHVIADRQHQMMIDNFHKHIRSRPALSVPSAKRAIPITIEQFVDSAAGPRRVHHALVAASRRERIECANAWAAVDHGGEDSASFQRSVQARGARSCVEIGSDVPPPHGVGDRRR